MQGATPDPELLQRFAGIVGARHALRDAADIAPYLREPRGLHHGRAALVLRPGSVDEVSRILALASATATPVVPQGGNTGLVGGQVPDASGRAVLLSLSRLDRIRDLDPASNTVIAEAGVILQRLRDAADAAGRLFPLALASQGSAQVGGLLSTNAGGTAVLAHGSMRALCLGLEVVLPTGELLDDLRTLRKDNTGYDLSQLFIGAEGTLGVITAAALTLAPKPRGVQAAWVAVASPQAALELLALAQRHAGRGLAAFELIGETVLAFALAHIPGTLRPLDAPTPWSVLLEVASPHSQDDARDTVERLLSEALEAGMLVDAALASSLAQGEAFWRLRESLSEAQRGEGVSIKHDIALPLARIPGFIAEGERLVGALAPGARIACFGHMGDGNLHYNVSQPPGMPAGDFHAQRDSLSAAVHALVLAMGGTISAEHGIGQLKRAALAASAPPVALDAMRRVKAAFDPAGIMNPGKLL
ncbi:FAD-binding oxidoreductase [Thermomonas brevis]